MVDKPLLDANVCLDLLLKRTPHINQAAAIFELSENGDIDAIISAISFDTLAYIMRKGFTISETVEKLKAIALITKVGTANTAVIESALNAGWNDVEDAIQYQCARENGCDAIITRNRKDFRQSDLPVFSPQEFLDQLPDLGEVE